LLAPEIPDAILQKEKTNATVKKKQTRETLRINHGNTDQRLQINQKQNRLCPVPGLLTCYYVIIGIRWELARSEGILIRSGNQRNHESQILRCV
jgi:hypothetical protein